MYRKDTVYSGDGKKFIIEQHDDGDRFVYWHYINEKPVDKTTFHVAMCLVKNELSFFEIARVFRVDLDYVKNVFDNLS